MSIGKEVGQKRETTTQEILTDIDRQTAIGILGTATSFGLIEVQLILASVSAILTAVCLGIQIWKNLKK